MEKIKTVLWVDDLRNPPYYPNEVYMIARSVNFAKDAIENTHFDIIDLDHDAGIYAVDGGDYINVLNYLEARAHEGHEVKAKFRIHSFNPVGVVNMRAIIQRNGWKEVH